MTELPKTLEELTAIAAQTKQLSQLIRTTLPTMDGWCSVNKGMALAGLVLLLKPKTVVEIGVYAGRSLLPMAWAAKEITPQPKIIGIDPYDAAQSAKNEFSANEEWWGKLDHEAILKKFQEFMKRFFVGHVQLVRKPSDDVEPMACELLHIDGSHTDQAVRDAQRFGALVPVGGVVVLDDIMWIGGGVLRAIDTLEEMGFREIFRVTEENWNVMQRQ